MKKIKSKLFILFAFSIMFSFSLSSHAQNRSYYSPFTVYSIAAGGEVSTMPDWSLKLGVNRNLAHHWRTPLAVGESYKNIFEQIFLRYNFTDKALSLQPAIGYAGFIGGGKIGFNAEYSFSKGKFEFSSYLAGGISHYGLFSIMIGPKINFTKKLFK